MSAAEQAVETEDERDLGDELFQIRNHTLDDDRVRGPITAVEPAEGIIEVHYEVLTTREETSTEYPRPKTWSTSNHFVRLVEFCGYNSASAMQLEGEIVPLRNVSDDTDADAWEIDIDRMPGEGLLDRADYYNGALTGAIATAFVAGATLAPSMFGVAIPWLPVWMTQAAVGICALFVGLKFVYVPPPDDRRTLSPGEMEVGFDD